ncbi:MAG: YdbL family protein [Halioglobus sp.]|nr:YdbL family protein [Halioglobus sp.]
MQRTSFLRRTLAGLALTFTMALPAIALELDEAKSAGLVGETNMGYIAAVQPSPEVDALVMSINSQRKVYYQEIADKNGISLQAVEARAGLKAIEKTAPGDYVNTGDGWLKK